MVVLSGTRYWRARCGSSRVSHRLFNGPLEVRLLRYEPAGARPAIVAAPGCASRSTVAGAGRLGLSALAAVLMFLSAPTADVWPLMWIGIVPQIYVALEATTPKRAFLYGWLTGTIANTAAFFWMRGFLEHFGHMSALEALPIMMLLTSYQGLEFAFLSWGSTACTAARPGCRWRSSRRW